MAFAPFDCRVPADTPQGWRPARCKGPNGRRLCRWCGTEVTPPRRSWCGDECVAAFLDETNPGRRRLNAFERDQGRCRLCGRDVGRLEKWLGSHLRAPLPDYGDHHGWRARWRRESRRGRRRRDWLRARGLLGGQGHVYECDHIVPQVEGGGHAADNLRTLCIPCHKAETSKLAARRAAARRNP